jgi:signal transduction histidine kinase
LRGEQIHDAERQARLKIRKIEQAHGGRLWVSANLPHGAVFKFTVPAGDD